VLNHAIPYGRNLSLSYFLDSNDVPDPLMSLNQWSLSLVLAPGDDYVNSRNVWVAIKIANTLRGDNRHFECTLVPKNDIFTVTSGKDVLRYKLYLDVLVQI